MYRALTIAGSDSVGGAGIQADIKAFASFGVHGCSVITAVTAQSTTAVDRIIALGPEDVRSQLLSVLNDVDINAAKTGMLYSEGTVRMVAETLEGRDIPLVADPVLVAGVGDSLSGEGLVESLRRVILPLCDLVTPNLQEAEALAGIDILDEDDALRACEIIGAGGCSVYLKGGHMDSDDVVDILYHGANFTRFRYPRLPPAGHGGGCTLSAYITANLARGKDLLGSIMSARDEIQSAIATMYPVGKGVKVVNPMVGIIRRAEGLEVLHRLRHAVGRLESMLPIEWIPEGGSEIVYSLPEPRTVDEVAALESPMMPLRGCVRSAGGVAFGTSPHLASVTLVAMRHDPAMRAAMSLRYDDELVNLMEELGLNVVSVEFVSSDTATNDGIDDAIGGSEEFPDVVFDHGVRGREGLVRILGRNPEELLQKITLII